MARKARDTSMKLAAITVAMGLALAAGTAQAGAHVVGPGLAAAPDAGNETGGAAVSGLAGQPPGAEPAREENDAVLSKVGGFTFTQRAVGSGPLTYSLSVDTPAAPQGAPSDVRSFTVTAAVPEPATWAMMILGFALLGAGIRLRGAARRPGPASA